MVAHIVGGGPVWPQWLAGLVFLSGLAAALWSRGQRGRRLGAIASLVGLTAMVGACAALPGPPRAPAVTLLVGAPAAGSSVTSPLLVTLCDGRGTTLPGAGRLLVVLVDGRQSASHGEHTLRVELVTTDHREYAPPVLTEETVVVSGVGALPSPSPCRR